MAENSAVESISRVPSVDVYVTYRCNLRCSHCFVGDNLETGHRFTFESLANIIRECPAWGAREITFLGGEPTLYPGIGDAFRLAQESGLRTRMVTNGLGGFRRFMRQFDGGSLPVVGFSLDGSTPEIHNAIRGPKALERTLANIEESRERGYSSFAVTSISRRNAGDVLGILDLCDDLGFTHVNVHYVSNRGFADEDMVIPISEWQAICRRVRQHMKNLSLDVRIEQTFTSRPESELSCAVRQRDNLMFLPDGRVFMCPMFIDIPGMHAFTWNGRNLVPNREGRDERTACAEDTPIHCPAIPFVNTELSRSAKQRGLRVKCVLDKTALRGTAPSVPRARP